MLKEYHESIDSTNSEASRMLDAVSSVPGGFWGLHKKVIYSGHQTAGRGRMGRPFFSPRTGVYISLIYCPDALASGKPFDPAIYTSAAAVAVCRAIESLYGKNCLIKWVNDIYVNEKKVSGILTEGKLDPKTGKIGAIVVGIGVNIFTPEEDFPEELRSRAGSILDSSSDARIHQFVDLISCGCFDIFDSFDLPESEIPTQVMKEYRNRSNLIGKTVTVTPVIEQEAGRYEALVTDITGDARLVVKTADGRELSLSSGEVSLHS